MKKFVSLIILLLVCISLTSCGPLTGKQDDTVYGTYNVCFDPNDLSKMIAGAFDYSVTSDVVESLRFDSTLDLELTLNENGTYELQFPVLGFNNFTAGVRDSVKSYLSDGGLYTLMLTLYNMDKETVDKNIASRGISFNEAIDDIVSKIDPLTVRNEAFTSLSEIFGGISFEQKGDIFIAKGDLKVFDDNSLTLNGLMNFRYESGVLTLTSYNSEEYLQSMLYDSGAFSENSDIDVSYFNASVDICKNDIID